MADTPTAGAKSSTTSHVNGVLTKLITQELKPGDQLPSEPELAARYGVSRSTIREVLKLLEQDGLYASLSHTQFAGDVVAHPVPS